MDTIRPPESVTALLSELIRFDTHNPGGDEVAIASMLADRLRRSAPDQLELVNVPREGVRGGLLHGGLLMGAYVFARWGTPRVVINAHLDTVPPNAGWSRDPYAPVIENGRLWGLGACDTKGAVAAAVCALEAGRPKDVALLFTGDEEVNGTCMRAFLATDAAKWVKRVVVCEPTGCRVGTRHRGVMSIEALLHGEGGHSSAADHMPAPIADLARVAVAVADWGRARRDQGPAGFEGMCVNIAALDGGVAFNVVPETATLTLSIRPAPGLRNAPLLAELTKLIHSHAPSAAVTVPVDNESFQVDGERVCRELGWGEVTCIDLAFWTEAALLSEAGIDAVVYGPGDIGHAHAPDESVELSQLALAFNTFQKLIHGTG